MDDLKRQAYWRGADPAARRVPAEPPVQVRVDDAVPAILQKDHAIAALLAIFGGVFGIHKFYLGYYQTAFTMMAVSIVGGIVTFGLAAAAVWVVAVVEGATYATCTQTDFEETYVTGRRDWF